MAEDQEGEPSQDGPREGEWLSISAAARRLGITPRAIRSRIERGTLRWKAAGNTGRVVWLPSEGATLGPVPGEEADPEAEAELLREEIAELRVALARAEERVEAARGVAAAEVAAAKAETALLQAQLQREQARGDRLEERLAQPWWKRLLGG